MKRLFASISAVILAFFLLSCGKEASHRFSLPRESRSGALTGLDSLVDANPDSALKVLDAAIKQEENKIGKSVNRTSVNLMRLELLRAKAKNKAYVLFSADSLAVMQRMADYYHKKGNANDRMLSLYLLGCAYRDLGSAPRAIETWQQAVAEADTARADCDFSILMRIHSQMNEFYTRMRLPELAKGEIEEAEALCWRVGDTLNALIFEEKKCGLLFGDGKYEECIKATDLVYNRYLQYGYKNEASLSCVYILKSYLAKGEYEKAKLYLDIYGAYCLSESDHRKIDGGLAPYYIYKGNYYLGIGKLDSAEYCFHQAMPDMEALNNDVAVYKGLQKVYEFRHQSDSIAKYSNLYGRAKERSFEAAISQATLEAKNLYDYGVEQRIAKTEKEKKAQWRINFLITTVFFLLLIAFLCYFWMRHLHKKELELIQKEAQSRVLQSELSETRNSLDATNQELTALFKRKSELEAMNSELNSSFDIERERVQTEIRDKTQTIELLKLQKNNLEKAMSTMDFDKKMEKLRTFPILVLARNHLVNPKQNPFNDAYWEKIKSHVEDLFPTFYRVTHANGNISEDEYRVCLLTKAGFSVSEINGLMEKTEYASNTKKRLLKKIFGIDGKPADFDQHIAAIV